MKKTIILLLCSLFWLSATIAYAGSNIMKIHDVTAIPGENITISIEVINEDQFVAFQVDIPLPEGFGYVAGSFVLTARSNGHLANASVLPGSNIFRALAFSLTNSPFNGNSGVVISFSLTTPAVAGTHTLVPTNAIISNPQGLQILTGTINGTITLTISTTVTPGDANCDGSVNVIDVIAIVNFILGNNPQPFCFENADVNNDGSVNAIDVIGTVNIIMGGGSFTCGNPFTDSRDGQSYSTVQIGTQCWMAENLNTGTRINGGINQTNNGLIEKYCYNNSESNCDIYGGLYQWDEMMSYSTTPGARGICPIGWHLPDDAEWTALTNFVCSQPACLCNSDTNYIAKALAATTNWWSTNINTCAVGYILANNNATGFTSLPGGYYFFQGSFHSVGASGIWWSSTAFATDFSWLRFMYYYESEVFRNYGTKVFGYSVRCLKD